MNEIKDLLERERCLFYEVVSENCPSIIRSASIPAPPEGINSIRFVVIRDLVDSYIELNHHMEIPEYLRMECQYATKKRLSKVIRENVDGYDVISAIENVALPKLMDILTDRVNQSIEKYFNAVV